MTLLGCAHLAVCVAAIARLSLRRSCLQFLFPLNYKETCLLLAATTGDDVFFAAADAAVAGASKLNDHFVNGVPINN